MHFSMDFDKLGIQVVIHIPIFKMRPMKHKIKIYNLIVSLLQGLHRMWGICFKQYML